MSNRADQKGSLKIRVLLVDDNEAFLRVATDFLQRHHDLIVVGAICGGEEALAEAPDLRPQVILIGLDMPGMTGLETISRLRNTLPGVGIIVLTLLEGAAHRKAAMATGADDVVRKAALTTELLPAIRRVMQANRGIRRHRSSWRRVYESERLTADPYPRERSWWAAGWFAFPKKGGGCYRACFEVRTGRR